jgi:membrane-bound hydrogenase subunit alpha
MTRKTTYPLSIGPTHPAFKEPIKFLFEIDGERVVDVDIDWGYTHRAIEVIARERNFIQAIYLMERICGICSVSHPIAYCHAVEQAADIPVPPRAKYIRSIIGELERLHSHLLWAGVACHEIGFDTLFMYTWNIREKVMDCLETITGNRVNYGMLTIGGVRRDITPELMPAVREVVDYYLELFDRVYEILIHDLSVKARCQGVGILTKEEALANCAVGPTARASGLKRDVRVDYPIDAYADMHWLKPVTPEDIGKEPVGDVYDRIIVRVLEIKQSIDIIRFCMDNMPEGEIVTEKNAVKVINTLKKIKGEGIGRYEGPRGEVTHYDILDGLEGPAQLKVKAPTYSNAISWIPMLRNAEIADIPIIVASIDPCIACADRMTFVGKDRTIFNLSSSDLHRMSVEKMKEVKSRCRR